MNWLEKLMHYSSELVKRSNSDSQISEIKDNVPIITGLASTAALTMVEHKYIMMQKYQNLSKVILLLLIIINL